MKLADTERAAHRAVKRQRGDSAVAGNDERAMFMVMPALRELQHLHRPIDVRGNAERAHEQHACRHVIVGRKRPRRLGEIAGH